MRKLLGIAILSVGIVSGAQAMESVPHHQSSSISHNVAPNTPTAAPEIDPGSALSALTLLAGSLAVVRGRFASRRK